MKLIACFIALPLMAQIHWDFESGKAEGLKPSGTVKFESPGPRAPEFPAFSADNKAVDFQSPGARLSLKDPGADSPYDYKNGDAIGIEAWVNLFDFTASPMYIIGKGRTGSPDFPQDNQNWALRVIVKNEKTHLSFLFATPEPGEQHWHRWTSSATFPPFDGWHHVAVTYRFGEQAKGLLDKTLIVITTDPGFDGGGGRGHQGRCFTCVLAGGGLRHQGAYGQTDELSKKVTADKVSVPDFFATICAATGVDYHKYLYDGDRPVPITDNGTPIRALFS